MVGRPEEIHMIPEVWMLCRLVFNHPSAPPDLVLVISEFRPSSGSVGGFHRGGMGPPSGTRLQFANLNMAHFPIKTVRLPEGTDLWRLLMACASDIVRLVNATGQLQLSLEGEFAVPG